MKIFVASIFAGIMLMACTPATEPAPVVPPAPEPTVTAPADLASPPADACGAAQYAGMVGKPITEPGVPAEGPNVRYIRPDTQVTMDFRPDRLNIDIDATDIITGFRCT
jgi:hypothetical protein